MYEDSVVPETWLICTCDITHSYVTRDSFVCVRHESFIYDIYAVSVVPETWLFHSLLHLECRWDVNYLYVWHDSFLWLHYVLPLRRKFICVTWLIRTWDVTHSYVWDYLMTHSYMRHDLFVCVTWLISVTALCAAPEPEGHVCDMTHSYVGCDSVVCCCDSCICVRHEWCICDDFFVCETWLIRMCDKTCSYVWHDSFVCVTWLIHTRDVTHSHVMTPLYVGHDLFTCETWLSVTQLNSVTALYVVTEQVL
jgi:hypothetical protein